MCKKWCIGVMVYFSIKIGSNCTLIYNLFNYIIIEVKSEGTEGYGVCENWCIGVMVYFNYFSFCTLIHHYTIF